MLKGDAFGISFFLCVLWLRPQAFDWTNSTTWPVAAQYSFVVVKLCFAFSPILALVAVFAYAWESPEEERLKRNKKADFTFDSPE